MTTSTTTSTREPVAPATRHAHKTRRRATKACLSCRARKVRCDVSQRGKPCMNCYLDSEACIVTNRASRFRKADQEGNEDAQVSHPPYPVIDYSHGSGTAGAANNSGVQGDSASPPEEHLRDPHAARNAHTSRFPALGPAEIQLGQESYLEFNVKPEPALNQSPDIAQTPNHTSSMAMQSFGPLGYTKIPFLDSDQSLPIPADITYSYYPFLSINLNNIMPQYVNFLESEGCFRIPTRPILDEFVQQYFLHVHPLLPLINEDDFWNLYCQLDIGVELEKMSLLVFQAMLFSCCNFVSKSSIKALGFANIRTARATLYRRTKLLFDFDTETSLLALSQAALLLSFWVSNPSFDSNTAWLCVAIQNAKNAEAHIYSAMPTFSPVTEPIESRKQRSLKRLWWCCIVRDRLISLCMRRSIQISRAHFDVSSNSSIGFLDLVGEVGQSKVYDAKTKRHLIEMFLQLSELCSILTDVLTLVFPLDDVPGWGRYNGAEGAAKVRECKVALRRWYQAATLRFPIFGGNTSRRTTGDKPSYHDSVILYTNLIYMIYHSARAALCQHEVLQIAIASTSPGPNIDLHRFPNIYESRQELKDAAYGVTECVGGLIQRRLARWLPISALSFTAMPLVLHIIDVKLSSHNKRSRATPDEKRRTALKQHRLNVLIEAMKTYQPQYDPVDYISETIRHIVNLAQVDPQSSSISSITSAAAEDPTNSMQTTISDWTDILASNPSSYLRLSMTMDISISRGRLAKETDFPAKIRDVFAHGLDPIRELFEGDPTTAASIDSQTLTPMRPSLSPTARIQPGSALLTLADEEFTSLACIEGSHPAGPFDADKSEQTQVVRCLSPPRHDYTDNGHVSAHIHDMFVESGLDVDFTLPPAAYAVQTDDKYPGYEMDARGGGQYVYNGEGDAGKEIHWIEDARDGEGGTGYDDGIAMVDDGDKETAQALLDALRGGDYGDPSP
ncbi:hypothetical protein F4861DRAFT_366671 [Xylaria intraflava]|nr:hypothetical protein F4861DRAFT_366671 [Xylaria intraflava]